MSKQEKLQVAYDALVRGFILPLLRGETVVLEQPIAPGAIAYFEFATTLDGTSDREAFDLLHRHGSHIARMETVPWPDRDVLLLAMIAYDLLTITDPKLDRVFARGARVKVVGWIDAMLAAVAPPRTRGAALARHALLDPFVGIRRRDVTAKSWAYTYRFKGRPTSSNLLTRPIFGAGFDETTHLTDVGSVLEAADPKHTLGLRERLRELVSRSPVTELLREDASPSLRFGLATLAVLSDDAIRGGIAREIATRGERVHAARIGRALADELLQHASTGHLYFALALAFEIQATVILDETGPTLPAWLDGNDPDLARYAAVLAAFVSEPSMAHELAALDPRDQRALRERAALLETKLPDAALEEVKTLCRRAARPDVRKDETMRHAEVSL